MASASDIPHKFDVVINGEGYLFADTEEQKAVLALSAPFIPRTSIQGGYGDSDTEFFQTFAQKDWAKGEQLKYARPGDEDSASRYWQGTNVDVSVPGQVSLRPLTNQTTAFGAAVTEVVGSPNLDKVFATGTANLFEINAAGTITDRGAHGLGAAPTTLSIGGNVEASIVYMSTTNTGTVGVRRWGGSAFSTFSATGADSLAYLNNTLYGFSNFDLANGSRLIRYDTAGTATVIFTWKEAAGGPASTDGRLVAYGGKLLILLSYAEGGSELWLYDGTAPAKIANFANGFTGLDLAVVNGSVFVGGYYLKRLSSATYRKPAIQFYTNGSLGELWRADSFVVSTSSREPRLTGFQGGLLFTDDTRGALMFYDPEAGGIHTIGSYTFTDAASRLTATNIFALHTRAATQPYRHPADGFSTSGTVTSPLIDFDSSLTKLFRGIKIEYDEGSDGDGGSIDIAYRVGDVDGAYTTLQTGAVSGTEYTLTNITGRTVSIKLTLNKGTSTSGPVLKRVHLRAVPMRASFRDHLLFLNCTGRDGQSPLILRNGQAHTKDGDEMLADLRTAAASSTPITIVDATGSWTGVIDKLEVIPIRAREYVARVRAREV